MLLTNLTSSDYYVGAEDYLLVAGGTLTIPDAIYNADDSVAAAVNSLVASSKASASSTPTPFPRGGVSSAGILPDTAGKTAGQALVLDAGLLPSWNTVSGGSGSTDGWVDDTASTWTYASTSTFTVATDQTAKFQPGTRLRFKQGGSYLYFYVASSSFSAVTTVTIALTSDYTLANAAITNNYYSYTANPQGFPASHNFVATTVGWSGSPTSVVKYSCVGRLCLVYFYFEGTSNASTASFTVPIASQNDWGASPLGTPFQVRDNGTTLGSPGMVSFPASGGFVMALGKDYGGSVWTASGTKRATGELWYQI